MEVVVVAKLNNAFMKYIKGKINPYNALKGSNLSGTLAAIYRMFYLKNNYCLYDNDRILYIAKTNKLMDNVNNAYNTLKNKLEYDYMTLFSFGDDRVEFLTIDEIVEAYFKEYASKNMSSYKIIDDEERNLIIKAALDIVKQEYKALNTLKDEYIGFFSEEIKWMKSFDYTDLEAYQICDRKSRKHKKGEGPSRLIKNSKQREAIHRLFTIYEDKLSSNNYVDREDMEKLALIEVQAHPQKQYTHIFLDECNCYSKKQLMLAHHLKNNRTYGELTYIFDNKIVPPAGAFLTKSSKILDVNGGQRVKSFIFNKPIEDPLLSLFNLGGNEQDMDKMTNREEGKQQAKTNIAIENFKFISLKTGMEFDFIRDISRKDSIILVDDDNTEEIGPEEMKEIPVFSNIAAGEPIFMNPEVQDSFYLPNMWVKGSDNHFILQVKGDSMIGAGIDDGDYVIIRSTPSAQNRDIVAVDIDGNATLKRLIIKGRSPVLMPENEKHDPIPITSEGVHILGVAVGVLKATI
jgi:SOS regulatory protein LexA